MRHRKKGNKLNRTASHRKAMLSNMAASLVRSESIRTTHAKAKEIRPVVERLITLAKRGDLHARRRVLKVIKDRSLVAKLFDDISTRFDDRNGGYLRIVKLGQRKGDGANISIVEFVGSKTRGGEEKVEQAEAAKEAEKIEQVEKEPEKEGIQERKDEAQEANRKDIQEETEGQKTDEVEQETVVEADKTEEDKRQDDKSGESSDKG